MDQGINSRKLFYAVSSFLLLLLIMFSIKVNYAISSSEPEKGNIEPKNQAPDGIKNPLTIKKAQALSSAPGQTEVQQAQPAAADPANAEPAAVSSAQNVENTAAAAFPNWHGLTAASSADPVNSEIELAKLKKMPGKYRIVVDKSRYELVLFKNEKPVKAYKVAIGRNPDGGDKKMKGDYRTPEGHFYVVSIEKSDKWLHNGTYAYGPWFLRLKTPWNGIAIHGTDVPESLGTKASEGCVRLHSDCITELKKILEQQHKSKDKIYVDIIKDSSVLENNKNKNN